MALKKLLDKFNTFHAFLPDFILKKGPTFLTSPGSCLGLRVTSFHLFNSSAQLPSSSSVHSFCTSPDPDSSGSSSSSSSVQWSTTKPYLSCHPEEQQQMSEKSVIKISKLTIHSTLSEATKWALGCFSKQEQADMLSLPFLYYIISQFISVFWSVLTCDLLEDRCAHEESVKLFSGRRQLATEIDPRVSHTYVKFISSLFTLHYWA